MDHHPYCRHASVPAGQGRCFLSGCFDPLPTPSRRRQPAHIGGMAGFGSAGCRPAGLTSRGSSAAGAERRATQQCLGRLDPAVGGMAACDRDWARPSAERCCQGVNLCFCPEWRPGLPGWAQIPGRSGDIQAGPGFPTLPADGCRVITYDRRGLARRASGCRMRLRHLRRPHPHREGCEMRGLPLIALTRGLS